jgi:hypothetical protein
MEVYVTTAFWIGIISLLIRGAIMSTASYPRTETKSLGGDLFAMLIQAGFVVWCTFLLWVV